MKNRSVMQHAFSMVPKVHKPRSAFNRSHGHKTTFDCDYLVPIYGASAGIVSPGDTVNLRHSILVRLLSPTLKPFMDNLYLDWFYFFVPLRLLWSNFQKFMGEQLSPADSISYVIPQCTGPNVAAGGIAVGSLHDYFGLPVGPLSGGGGTTGLTFNNFFPRAYNRVYQDWFKDENLQNAVTLDTGDGPDTYANYVLLKRGKRHDYFTSCLPFLQKGSAVTMSLGTTAPVIPNPTPTLTQYTDGTSTSTFRFQAGLAPIEATTSPSSSSQLRFAAQTGLLADLSTASSSTINTLRQSITLQQFLENDARGGTRYTEIVKQRWGVTSPDARLQRSELLALGGDRVKINPVTNTANSSSPNFQGQLTGFGVSTQVGDGFVKSFTEHGVIIGLVSARADLTYQQGLDRHWSYRTRYDLINPEFCNLGEQAVLNKEIYANVPDGSGASQKDGVFGYQERYAEGRYSKSLITGKLRSGVSGTLDLWTLSEEFSALPTLGATFIQSAVPLDRVIAVPSEPHFILDSYFSEKWARVMPVFSVPGLTRL